MGARNQIFFGGRGCQINHLQKWVVGHAGATRATVCVLPHDGTGEQRWLPPAQDLVLPQPLVILVSCKHKWSLFRSLGPQQIRWMTRSSHRLFLILNTFVSNYILLGIRKKKHLNFILFVEQFKEAKPDLTVRPEIASVLLHSRVLRTWCVHDMQNM